MKIPRWVRKFPFLVLVSVLVLLSLSQELRAWSCKTHVSIAREGGVKNAETACFPDFSKKENEDLLGPLHWHNAAPATVVTPDYIYRYKAGPGLYVREGSPRAEPLRINVPHPAGVLYWKICDLYEAMQLAAGREYDYYLVAMAHYAADLSQPLHNFPHGSREAADGKVYPEAGLWAKEAHAGFDSVLDPYLPLTSYRDKAILVRAPVSVITSLSDLQREVSKIANSSIALANRCYTEKRNLTREEALTQAAMSVALIKGIKAGRRASLIQGGNPPHGQDAIFPPP